MLIILQMNFVVTIFHYLPKNSIEILPSGEKDKTLNVIFNHPFRSGEVVNQVIVKKIFKSVNRPKLLELLPSRDNVIFKVGDNLLHQICLSISRVFNTIWKEINVQVHFKIGDRILSLISAQLPHSSLSGFISYVDAESLTKLWDRNCITKLIVGSFSQNGLRKIPQSISYINIFVAVITEIFLSSESLVNKDIRIIIFPLSFYASNFNVVCFVNNPYFKCHLKLIRYRLE